MRTSMPTAFILVATTSAHAGGPSFQGIGTGTGSTAVALSGDGSTVVGRVPTAAVPAGEAFRWTDGEGLVGIGDLPGGAGYSEASAVSHDGSAIVGRSFSGLGFEAFRWTASDGMMIPLGVLGGASWAFDVSDDGQVVVGGSGEAFMWTPGGGMDGLGDLGPCCNSAAFGVSGDGAIIVGTGDPVDAGTEGFRWTSRDGMVGLGPGNEVNSEARAISADGSVIVGFSNNEAVMWTASGKVMTPLGPFPGGATSTEATAVSADGSVIVGFATRPTGVNDPFIWDAADGMRNLVDVLTDLGIDLTGWTLREAWGVSADGLTVAGTANNASGAEAWIATLADTSDPADLDGDGVVGISDFLTLLANWGPCPDPPAECPADLDGDGTVGITDLLILLASWG